MLLETFDSRNEVLSKHRLTFYVNEYLNHVYVLPSTMSTPSPIHKSSPIHTNPQDEKLQVQTSQPLTKQPTKLRGSGSQTHPTLEESIAIEYIVDVLETQIQHVYVQIRLGTKVKFIEKPTHV
jgi:hypothetical protein